LAVEQIPRSVNDAGAGAPNAATHELMSRLNVVCSRIVWWTGWPLFPVVFGFLFTGYAISGRYGFDRLLDERTALTLHKLMHAPLIILVLVHSLPAMYLALQRWGWLRRRQSKAPGMS
jgi:hypothetical protein